MSLRNSESDKTRSCEKDSKVMYTKFIVSFNSMKRLTEYLSKYKISSINLN